MFMKVGCLYAALVLSLSLASTAIAQEKKGIEKNPRDPVEVEMTRYTGTRDLGHIILSILCPAQAVECKVGRKSKVYGNETFLVNRATLMDLLTRPKVFASVQTDGKEKDVILEVIVKRSGRTGKTIYYQKSGVNRETLTVEAKLNSMFEQQRKSR